MTEQEWELVYYETPEGELPFREWFELLRDYKARTVIDAKIARLRAGNFGNCEPVGQGVLKLKIYYGPGYRVYIGRVANRVVLLLCGGDKSTQRKDILEAHRYWQQFKER